MEELWLKGKDLVPEEEWVEAISSLRSEDVVSNKEDAKRVLREKLMGAVESRLPGEKFGILFSGGVDSSLIAAICKKLGKGFTCYVVGFQDEETKEPEDIIEAKKVAERLGFELRHMVFDLKEAEEIIKGAVKILKKVGKADVVNVGVGAVVLAAVGLGKEEGVDYFLGGLGSEEIFAGYERHDKAEEINKECWSGLNGMWSRDLVRDFNLAKELEIVVRTPFLDKELIEYAMKLPEGWKIVEEKKKVILREVAEEFLGEFAWRKKKAAQYGSCFDKAISKLARKNGFKFKKDYLRSL